MRLIVLLIAAFLVVLGLTGVLYPEGLMGLAKYSFSPTGIIVIGIARIAIGLLLFVGANATRTPRTLRIIGIFIVIAGVSTLFITPERAQPLMDWWLNFGPDRLRMIACLPLAVGLLIGGSALFVDRKRPS